MILIGFGSNLSLCGLSPHDVITAAIGAVEAFKPVVSVSRLYRSPAWPDPSDPPFVNAVARLGGSADPERLLAALADVERAFGRTRGVRNAPRTLDLDLLDCGGLVRPAEGAPPVLPHPAIASRDFVLRPLLEVAPEWRCPLTGETGAAMLARLPVTASPLEPPADAILAGRAPVVFSSGGR